MRHLKTGRKLNRNSSHRRAMWRNMTTSLLEHERIKTTDQKAKELRGFVEKMITIAKRARAMGDGTTDHDIAARQVHLRRQALAFVRDADVVRKLFSELAERFEERPGGYTRIIKIGIRRGDAAHMSYIELLGADETVGGSKKSTKKKAKAKPGPKPKAKAKAKPAVTEEPETVEEPVTEQAVPETAAEAPAEETPVEAEEEKTE